MKKIAILAVILPALLMAGVSVGRAADGGAVVKMLGQPRFAVDYEHAEPIIPTITRKQLRRAEKKLRKLRKAERRRSSALDFTAPTAFGLYKFSYPYTLSLVGHQMNAVGASNYRKTGKLYAVMAGKTVTCTASLIKPGIAVTAASCVSKFKGGLAAMATVVTFVPGADASLPKNPFGTWTAKAIIVPEVYTNGTDYCHPSFYLGLQCENDLALIVLYPIFDKRIGDMIGYYKYTSVKSYLVEMEVYGDYVFGGDKSTNVTILGYPAEYEDGGRMLRTDTFAFYNPKMIGSKVHGMFAGSPFAGGAAGAPWIVNFGTVPSVKPGYNYGESSDQLLIGVTMSSVQEENANNFKSVSATVFGRNNSYPLAAPYLFGYGNIGYLMTKACLEPATKDAC